MTTRPFSSRRTGAEGLRAATRHRPIAPRRAAFRAGGIAAPVALGLLLFALTGPAMAADYYVNNGSTGCSDAGPGTPASPYCTISAALLAHPNAGTTIHVMPGIYRERVTVPGSGASGSPLVLLAEASPGQPVVISGADDFSNPGLWTQYSGDVWVASSVNWAPKQVFADDARLAASTVAPASLPPRSFEYVAGTGLYVNAGGGNPATHRAEVGHRPFGVYASGRSWVTLDGFTVTRAEDRDIQLITGCTNIVITHNTVTFSAKFGIQVSGGSGVTISSNVVGDNADHGIALISGATACTITDNESFRNAVPNVRSANGLYLFGASANRIERNRFHDNQDTGLQIQSGSNDNVSIQNLSWNNGDHGYDHLAASGNVHIGDVAYGNYRDGFSIEGNSPNHTLENCIAIDNGLTTNEYDLWVDGASSSGFVSNDNIFWNSTAAPPVKYITTIYPRVSDYAAASGQDGRTIQADPGFVDSARGDFHLRAGSPAIDNANSAAPNWPSTDFEGRGRVDDPSAPNTGLGPVPYADRGALEFQPSTPANQPPTASLTVTPSSGTAPLNVTADASGSRDPDGTIVSYRFDFGDGTVVGPQPGSSATHTYAAAGSYTVQATVTDNGGATASATATVTVSTPANQPPTASLTVTPSSGTAPLPVVASAMGSRDPDGTIVSYRFDFGDGTVVGPQSASVATHVYGAGRWIAQVTVTDNAGASATASASVTVASLPAGPVGVGGGGGPGIRFGSAMLPNPLRSSASLVFATSRPGDASIQIFDLAGRQVRRIAREIFEPAGMHVVSFDGRGDDGALLPGGVYYYRIRSADGQKSGRFVIAR
jgi:parallel beta-helix repeat protein